jgi:dephospho-CoA kinase
MSLIFPDQPCAFALAGLPGCGKSTAAEFIEDEIQSRGEEAVATEVSDYVRARFEAEHDGEVNDNELGDWAAGVKAQNGPDHFVREMAEAHVESGKHTVISGVRSPAEADAVRDVFGPRNTAVIAVWTLPDLRFRRKYGATPSTEHDEWETFQERNERELHEWNCLDMFTGEADFIVPNNGEMERFEMALESIVREYVGDGSLAAHLYSGSPLPSEDPEVVAQYL